MKVCTDACLFGAWVAADPMIQNATTLLDIGTGTGLLSLMLAQVVCVENNPAHIVAIEINDQAALQAKQNFEASPWPTHIQLVHDNLQNFEHAPFECIVTNPPFFEGDLQSPNTAKNLAAHSTALPWTILINKVAALLKEDGYYYVLIPALRAYTMQKLASEKGIQLVQEMIVSNAEHQNPFRVLQKYKKTNDAIKNTNRSQLIIKDASQNYTPEFISLLSPYYLHL